MKWAKERDEVLAKIDALAKAGERLTKLVGEVVARVAAIEAELAEGDTAVQPPAPPPAGAGPLAWRALKHADSGVQIARVKPEDERYPKPLPWVFENNDVGGRKAVIGQGFTTREAFEDYIAKGGKAAPANPPDDLTAAERAAATKFGSTQPPTSTRRGGDGFYCDAFRPSGFHGKVGPFTSYDGAVNALARELGADF